MKCLLLLAVTTCGVADLLEAHPTVPQSVEGGGLLVSTPNDLCRKDQVGHQFPHTGPSLSRPSGTRAVAGAPPVYRFNPMGGNLDEDVIVTAFVDLGPGNQLRDYACGELTYNGHAGVDVGIASWEHQAIGVPVFAVEDGIVSATDDGHPDMNLQAFPGCGDVANYVSLTHAGGWETHYWHLKLGSVSVMPGQLVRAGQQLGAVGSSGCSSGPHLHFETSGPGGVTEPYAGPCDPFGLWEDQPTFTTEINVPYTFQLTGADPDNFPPPETVPGRGMFVATAGLRRVASSYQLRNVPPTQNLRVRIRRPDGTLAVNTVQAMDNTTFLERAWGTRFHFVVLDTVGTWGYELNFNGVPFVHTTFEVVAEPSDIQNRPPHDIAGAVIDPAHPRPGDHLRCRVLSDTILDDPDFDTVRYRYVWRVNGEVVRDLVSAGQSDQLAAGLAGLGARITCDVTPTDDEAPAATVRARAQIEIQERSL